MALPARRQRLVLAQRGERAHRQVAAGHRLRIADARQVCRAWTMTALAVDAERLRGGAVRARRRVERDANLAAMTGLAVAEPWLVADDTRGRPVDATRQRQRGTDGDPSPIVASDGVAEPRAFLPAVVERKEAPRPVGEAREEALRPASLHVSAADHAMHREHAIVGAGLLHRKRDVAA